MEEVDCNYILSPTKTVGTMCHRQIVALHDGDLVVAENALRQHMEVFSKDFKKIGENWIMRLDS